MPRYFLEAIILSLAMYTCNPTGSHSEYKEFASDSDYSYKYRPNAEIVYALKIPTDIVSFFEETGTGFDPELTIPLEKMCL